jgi:7,8-didemethyl-8-hydroxy-5-deazariboflavin synthase CofG subunit
MQTGLALETKQMSLKPLAGTIARAEAVELIQSTGAQFQRLLDQAQAAREDRTGDVITYSRKVFIPLTRLCRDRCAYCTFAQDPAGSDLHTLTPAKILAIAQAGKAAGCKEALFSLGDKPELRYPHYRRWLADQGYDSTGSYLQAMCRLVLESTGLLPHTNAGVLSQDEMELLQPFNASMGMMLESASTRLLAPGQAHFACPDKAPSVRLRSIETAGKLGIPFTTGILIGIGETREERVDALFAIHELNQRYGHIQEVIIQNFRAKGGTGFALHPEPDTDDILRTAAVARLIFGSGMNIQVPPNLSARDYGRLLLAGINDWGGISPVTPDFINPEAAWPHVADLRAVTHQAGFRLRERLAIYPEYLLDSRWAPDWLRDRAAAWIDDSGLVSVEREGQ